jgi:hypothetical protein
MDEPLTPMTEASTQLHELFETLLASGFTQLQACTIVGVYMANVTTNSTDN